MAQDLEMYFETALQKLEEAYANHMKTKIYDADGERIKILIELIKEQMPHENTDSTTR